MTATMFSAQSQVRRALAGLDLGSHVGDLVRDAIGGALPTQWEARARVFEDCRPKPGDYLGSDPSAAARIDARCARSAAACRLHAALLRGDDLLDADHAGDRRLLGVTV
ncbi:MAG: hypothetical protein QM286_14400 [Acidobacteriota bacterium]|nr:hypothetical protein [Acidobacteriota bacterium]